MPEQVSNDLVNNDALSNEIYGGSGNDSLLNLMSGGGNNASLYGEDGDDYIANLSYDSRYNKSILDGGKGNDTIRNYNGSHRVIIYGGAGNDIIENGGSASTITGGKGNDLISLSGNAKNNLILYNAGDGNDTISGFNANSTLKIGDGKVNYSTVKSGSDIIVLVGEDKITLQGTAYLSKVNIAGQFKLDKLETNFYNRQYKALVLGNDIDNTIKNSGSNVTIQGQGGNDTIYNGGSNVSIDAGEGNDTISNRGDNVSVSAGAGNDKIINYGKTVIIDGGADNDTIYNDGNTVTISGGAGDDSIYNNDGNTVTISGGAGDDSIYNNDGNTVTISGGAGEDHITNKYGRNVTIDGGAGDDTITNSGSNVLIQYASGDGNDLIQGFNSTSTLAIADNFSTEKSGYDIIVTVGDGKISLIGAASLSRPNIIKNIVNIDNTSNNKKLVGGNLDDTIKNSGQNVTIQAKGGNDFIFNKGLATLYGGEGNDSIINQASNSKVFGGNGNDSIVNNRSNVTISGGTGDDNVINYGEGNNTSISGGEGNDSIDNWSSNVTISGGVGDDSIFLGSAATKNVIQYAAGDGNDLIKGFNETSTLSISDAMHSTETNGNDIIVTVGEEKITLEGAASLSSPNIINSSCATFTIKDSKITADLLFAGRPYLFRVLNKELKLLTLLYDLKDYIVTVKNEDDSTVETGWIYGTVNLSGNSTME